MKTLRAAVVVALLGGSVGCTSTTRPPAAALVETRGLATPTAAAPATTTSSLAPVCGKFVELDGKTAAIPQGPEEAGAAGPLLPGPRTFGREAAAGTVGALVLFSPFIITYLVVSAPLRLVKGLR